MPRFKSDLYIDDIYVKTYFVDADSLEDAYDHFDETVRSDLFLDTEEIED